ncbi:MAG: LysR substrate-binding domain-containing protein [Caulobacteraceae bacterium]
MIASPDYLRRRGAPVHPRELLGHDCIAFQHATSGQMEQWAFERGDERFELAISGRLIVNDSTAMAQAVLDGAGIGYMSNGFIEGFLEEGRLVRLLAGLEPARPRLRALLSQPAPRAAQAAGPGRFPARATLSAQAAGGQHPLLAATSAMGGGGHRGRGRSQATFGASA